MASSRPWSRRLRKVTLGWRSPARSRAGREASRGYIMLSYMLHIDQEHDRAVADFKDGAVKEFYEFQVGVNGRPEPDSTPDEWYEDISTKTSSGPPMTLSRSWRRSRRAVSAV